MNTRAKGLEREEEACRYLERRGVIIKERNFRCKLGEIDIIGYDGDYLVFFEVKYRKDASMGSAAEAVGVRKQQRICRVCDWYRMTHGCKENIPIRFDVVAIDGDEIRWLKNAFEYRER